ncbi:MAG: hypothetical protein WDO74_14450 [Pseudomonadota bacterium]
MPRWRVPSESRAAEPPLTNPYAPIRSRNAAMYSWQSEKRAQCIPESLAQRADLEPRSEPGAARAMLAAFPERTSDPGGKTQAPSPDLVVAGLRHALHHCFSRWLDARVDAQGSVRFALELGCAGEVEAISAENQGVDESTLTCLFSAVAPARFAPPAGGHATVLVPVVFKNAAR